MYDKLTQDARQSLSAFLASYPWTLWFTSTSRDKESCRYPTVALHRALSAIHGFHRGFVAAERHYLGGWHAHGMVFSASDPGLFEYHRTAIESDLSRHGFCRVEPANSWPAVSAYLAKYVAKGADAEWVLTGGPYAWYERHRLPLDSA